MDEEQVRHIVDEKVRTIPAAMEIARIAQAVRNHEDFVVACHERPDGDAVGSLLAVYHTLLPFGKRVTMVSPDAPNTAYDFLPGFERILIGIDAVPPDVECFIICDTASAERTIPLPDDGRTIINIDHHVSNTRFGSINLVVVEAGSATEILLEVLEMVAGRDGREIPIEAVEALYVGLATDTGNFAFAHTTAHSLDVAARLVARGIDMERMAKYLFQNKSYAEVMLAGILITRIERSEDGRLATSYLTLEDTNKWATPQETRDLVNILMSIHGTAVALFFFELEPGVIKVSLRSDGSVDVNVLAAVFDGGGHVRAAGCKLTGTLEEVKAKVIIAAETALSVAVKPDYGRPDDTRIRKP